MEIALSLVNFFTIGYIAIKYIQKKDKEEEEENIRENIEEINNFVKEFTIDRSHKLNFTKQDKFTVRFYKFSTTFLYKNLYWKVKNKCYFNSIYYNEKIITICEVEMEFPTDYVHNTSSRSDELINKFPVLYSFALDISEEISHYNKEIIISASCDNNKICFNNFHGNSIGKYFRVSFIFTAARPENPYEQYEEPSQEMIEAYKRFNFNVIQ
jgi:hypothetical protein